MKNIIIIMQGMFIGAAEIVPGISGSTIALLIGIYEDFINLLHSISEFFKELVKLFFKKSSKKILIKSFKKVDFNFGIFLGLGMLLSFAIFSSMISFLLFEYKHLVYSLFFGLILGTIFIPFIQIENKDKKAYITIFFSSVLTFLVLGFNSISVKGDPNPFYILFGGIVGVSGLLLPGVSGSFILLMLGLYEYVINLLKNSFNFNLTSKQFINLLFLIMGIVIGMTFFVRLLRYLLKNHKDLLLSILVGILTGSLRVINPVNQGEPFNILMIFLILFGFCIVWFLRQKNKL